MVLIPAVYAKVSFIPLDDTTVYAEDIGAAKLYHTVWHLAVSVDPSQIEQRFIDLHNTYENANRMCQDCAEQFELKILDSQIGRLDINRRILNQLLETRRIRRGLFNFIGSVSKTLFGTLEDKDLEYINNELDKLYASDKILSTSITNQTKVIKTILNSASHDIQILNEHSKANVERLNKMINETNTNTRSIIINNQITICTLSLQELSEDINLLIDSINDGKHGIIHPQILTPKIFLNCLYDFEQHNNMKYQIPLKEENFQNIIDISQISISIVNKRLLYSIKVPQLETETYQVHHLIPIPKKIQNTFLAVIPEHDYILLDEQRTLYVPSDEKTINDCKKLDKAYVCKRAQPIHLVSETESCENLIIRSSIKRLNQQNCQFSPFRVNEIVFIQLRQENSYIVIPEKSTTLHVFCETSNEYVKLESAQKITSNESCTINSEGTIMKINPSKSEYKETRYVKDFILPYDKNDFELLNERLIPLQKYVKSENIREASQTLDDIENALNKIKNDRRTKHWTSKMTDV